MASCFAALGNLCGGTAANTTLPSGPPMEIVASASLPTPKGRKSVSRGRSQQFAPSTALIAISDPGQDLDDEMSFIMMRYLVEHGLLELRGIITTLHPAYDRARLARGTLNLLGLHRVPIGVGTDGGDLKGNHTAALFEEGAKTYMPTANSEEAMLLEPGRRLMNRLYRDASPKELTLLIIASLKDAALFLRDNEDLFAEKTKEVVIQGGIIKLDLEGDTLPKDTYFEPDTSNNQTFDKEASAFLIRRCQELGVPITFVSRHAAGAAQMPRDTYDRLALSGSSIGRRLRNAQKSSLEQLWQRATQPADDPKRKGLPARCDRPWFIKTFCSGQDDGRSADQPVWDLVKSFNQYDTMALLAAVPTLREKFFKPLTIKVSTSWGKITPHFIIGVDENEPNLVKPTDSLVELLHDGYEEGLYLNHHAKSQVILVAQLRPDTVVDLSLMAVMLRTLYELETVHAIGILLVSEGSGTVSPGLAKNAERIREALDLVGLKFVPVNHAENADAAAKRLKELYAESLPTGVTLIVSASLTAPAAFVDLAPDLFHEKTRRVVLISGARRREHKAQWLEPDPDAQNNNLDMEAARNFFLKAQELSVPLTILSRFAARAGSVPRAIFDVMASHCGPIGRTLFEAQRSSMQVLWKQACAPNGSPDRGGLPPRCNRDWFLTTFCSGKQPANDDDVWNEILTFNAYSPLALLIALPEVVKSHVQATPVQVRAATHEVIGWSADDISVPKPSLLRRILVHGLVYGARCNVSEFALGKVPPISLGSDPADEMRFDLSEEALDGILWSRSSSFSV